MIAEETSPRSRPAGLSPRQFEIEVFPAEMESIAARRHAADSKRPAATSPGGGPSTDHQLVGLALSGGGIRSATFSLGVLRALEHRGLLRHVDYLSTVSGGGFIGACLSALMRQPGAPFPFTYGSRET